MKKLLSIVLAIGATVTIVSLGGCKQQQGERCQVSEDCEEPLVCASATQTCEGSTGGNLDAAPVPDAPPADAAVDAPPDAPN